MLMLLAKMIMMMMGDGRRGFNAGPCRKCTSLSFGKHVSSCCGR